MKTKKDKILRLLADDDCIERVRSYRAGMDLPGAETAFAKWQALCKRHTTKKEK